jgi:hypothetical protein
VSAFIPSGYISVHKALDLVGGELSSEWTGEEHKARAGLVSEEEWSKIKDVIPARGGGAPGGGLRLQVPQARPGSDHAALDGRSLRPLIPR